MSVSLIDVMSCTLLVSSHPSIAVHTLLVALHEALRHNPKSRFSSETDIYRHGCIPWNLQKKNIQEIDTEDHVRMNEMHISGAHMNLAVSGYILYYSIASYIILYPEVF